MCRVVGIRKVEECLNGTTIKEFELDAPMTETAMRCIAEEGKLDYYPNFPRPYFRIDRPNAYIIQGVIGVCTFRVIFTSSATGQLEDFLQQHVEQGENCGCQDSQVL